MFTVAAHLNFNVPAKTATLVDDTDLSVLNLAQVQVTGTATITGPDGTAIVTGITIDRSAGDTATTAFNLPLDNALGILNGTYSFTYALNFVVAGFSVAQFTATDTITIVGVDWSDIFDSSAGGDIIIAGATTPGNDGTWAVISAVEAGGDTDFEVAGPITTEVGGAATIGFDVTYPTFSDTVTYTGCDEADLTVSTPYYCNTTRYGQIVFEDTTELPSGQVLSSRLWTITYPGGLTNPVTPAPITGTAASITVNTLATGQWTYLLTYNVTVTQDDGLVYTYVVSKTGNVDVACITTLCDLQCGIYTFITNYSGAVLGGAAINQFTNTKNLLDMYFDGALLASQCGNQEKFELYAGLILDQLNLVGVDCGCGCSGSETTTEGNHWIDNGSDFVSGTPPQWSIFQTTTPINPTTGLNPDSSSVLPTSTFGTVSIPPEYFQLAGELGILGLTNGKKFVTVEYSAFYGGGATSTSTLTVGGQTVINAINLTIDVKIDVKVKIGTRLNGSDTVFCIQVNINKIDANAGTADYSIGYFEFDNLIDAATNLAIIQTGGGAGVASLIVFDVNIYPSQQI